MSAAKHPRAARLLTCVPVGVQTTEKERVGLIRDASTSGALLFSKSRFAINDSVKLNIRVDSDESNNVKVEGRIVRIERLTEGFWSFKIGVRFDPPREDLGSLFNRLAERQERLFGSGG